MPMQCISESCQRGSPAGPQSGCGTSSALGGTVSSRPVAASGMQVLREAQGGTVSVDLDPDPDPGSRDRMTVCDTVASD